MSNTRTPFSTVSLRSRRQQDHHAASSNVKSVKMRRWIKSFAFNSVARALGQHTFQILANFPEIGLAHYINKNTPLWRVSDFWLELIWRRKFGKWRDRNDTGRALHHQTGKHRKIRGNVVITLDDFITCFNFWHRRSLRESVLDVSGVVGPEINSPVLVDWWKWGVFLVNLDWKWRQLEYTSVYFLLWCFVKLRIAIALISIQI